MPFGPSLYQQHGHHQGARQKCRILGPTPDPGHPQEEWASSPGDSDNLLKGSDREGRGSVRWEHTCHDSAQGVQGPRGGDRGLRILKKLLKEASQWFWGNFLGKNPSFRKVLTKIFNTFPIIVNKPYPHYLSNLFHTTGGTARLEKCVITFSYLIISDRLIYRISLLKRIKMTLHSCFSKQLPPF